MKYKFKAKEKKTGKWVEGDLAYVETLRERTKAHDSKSWGTWRYGMGVQ